MGYRDYRSGIDGTCFDCKERYPACHDTCQKYIEARKNWEDKKAKIIEAKNEEAIYYGYKKEKIRKELKK